MPGWIWRPGPCPVASVGAAGRSGLIEDGPLSEGNPPHDRSAPRRWTCSIAGLLLLLAVSAGLFQALRPVSQEHILWIATEEFRELPGARDPEGAVTSIVQTEGADGRFWIVSFQDPRTGELLARFAVDSKGRSLGAIGGSARQRSNSGRGG